MTYSPLTIPGYEEVIVCKNAHLQAIVAIHSTTLGPALGGIRSYLYPTFDDALKDVLRLAKGMTYKAAVAQTGTGGGKSIIITDHKVPKSREMLLSFADVVNHFEGRYICAEDFGTTAADLAIIAERTPYVAGIPNEKKGGDPARFTAYGGLMGVRAVSQFLWGDTAMKGKRVAIQGLGSVGMRIAELLFWEGATLVVSDVDEKRVQKAVVNFGASSVSPEEIYEVPCDIFVPCALGGILNAQTIPLLQCKAVAGLANNQLLSEQDGDLLLEREILYAPDYVINAGGLIGVTTEYQSTMNSSEIAREDTQAIYKVLLDIFADAKKQGISTHQVAQKRAEKNILTPERSPVLEATSPS